jgi:hypothetical protein
MAITNQKHHTAGQTFMQAVLAKLPAEKQEQAKALFAGDDVDVAFEEAGAGALRQEDYSKGHDQMAAERQEIENHWKTLNTWYAGKKEQLDKTEALEAQLAAAGSSNAGAGNGNGDLPSLDDGDSTSSSRSAPPTREALLKTLGLDPSKIITADQLSEVTEGIERGMLSFYQEANPIGIEHYKTFGDVMDVAKVLAHPNIRQVGFKAAYADVYKEEFAAQAKAAQEAHDKQVGEEAVAEHLKHNTGNNFPIPGRTMPSGMTSPLEALEASMRTQPQTGQTTTQTQPNTAPGPGHSNLADDNAIVDKAVSQFLERAAELGRPVARV